MKTDIVNFMAHRLLTSYTCMENPLLWRIEKLRINQLDELSKPLLLKYTFFSTTHTFWGEYFSETFEDKF